MNYAQKAEEIVNALAKARSILGDLYAYGRLEPEDNDGAAEAAAKEDAITWIENFDACGDEA